MLIAISVIFVAVVLVAIFVLTIVLYKKYPVRNKGDQGELAVAKILGENIEGVQYVINDLLFEYAPGKTCQIDHIHINQAGIWVIETKNYAGRIYGQENDQNWMQVLANGRIQNQFYNPIKQNNAHIYHLSQYLKVKNIFHNIVVFLPNADISYIDSDKVYSLSQLESIKDTTTHPILSVSDMDKYYNLLLSLKNSTTVNKLEHIANINNMQELIRQGICPRCGGKLVPRHGKNGDFYGCSNYPKCKFTKKM